MHESRGVYCKVCGKCICKPGKRKYPENTFVTEMTCEICENGKFSTDKFSLHHLGSNEWAIKNDCNQTWMGKDGWVAENSTHHAATDSQIEIFTWNEVLYFVEKTFACDLVK